MEVIAKARYLRIAPRKVRLVCGLVRGMAVKEALAQLKFMNKNAALPVAKLIESAVANATHNFKMDASTLYIKAITADNGPTMKRWRGRAFGRMAPILKRSSHVYVTLAEREGASGLKAALVKPVAAKATEGKAVVAKPVAKKAAPVKKSAKPVSKKPVAKKAAAKPAKKK